MKKLESILEQLGRRHSLSRVFSDFLQIVVCTLSMGAKEKEYLEIISHYSKEEINLFPAAFAELVMEMDNDGQGLKDVLGEFFTIHITKGHNGQYFTPEPVCNLMAQMNEYQPGQSVCDPTCGSGRMLLAAARKERKLQFTGADNDLNCALMTVINLCLNGLEGYVYWMDSLKMEIHRAWQIVNLGVPIVREIEIEWHIQEQPKVLTLFD